MSRAVTISNELDRLISQAIERETKKQLVKSKTKKLSTVLIMKAIGKSRQTFNRLRKNPENFTVADLIKLSDIIQVDRKLLYEVVDKIASENLNQKPMSKAIATTQEQELQELTSFDKEDWKEMSELSQSKIKALQNDSDQEKLTKLIKLHQKILMFKDFS